MIDLKTYINEGLIWTYDPYFTIERTIKKFNLYNDEILLDDAIDNNTINYPNNHQKQEDIIKIRKYAKSFNIKYNDENEKEKSLKIKNDLNSFFNTFGWYYSNEKIEDNKIFYIYHPKFQHQINDKISKECKYLYHYTRHNLKNKILKEGLVPKSKDINLNYESRIHLLKDKIENLNNDDKNEIKQKILDKSEKLIEIKIDLSILDVVNFYIDPNLKNSSYITYNNIHPKYIKEIKDYEL